MALAGINTTNNALWLSKCKELHSKINNPYLRATFSFLTCGDNFKQILVSVILQSLFFATLRYLRVTLRPILGVYLLL